MVFRFFPAMLLLTDALRIDIALDTSGESVADEILYKLKFLITFCAILLATKNRHLSKTKMCTKTESKCAQQKGTS